MIRLTPLLGLAAVLLSASAGIASAEVVLNRGNDTDPATLDIHQVSSVSESNILRDLYEGLVTEAADGSLLPAVAERWDISPDGRTYTFHLRADAKWSNGDPVTAEDFVFALHRIMDPKTAAPYANILFDILNAEDVAAGKKPADALGAKAVDPQTLELMLRAPAPYFLQLLTHQTAKPLHRKSIEALGDAFTKPGNLVSNGAYTLASFVPNDRIVLKKNPEFWDAAHVAIDTINWIPFEDRSACIRRFEAGEVQICSDLPAEQMSYLKDKHADALHIAPYLGVYYLPVKTTKEKFADPRVRQAISMAIDRDFLAEEVWQGTMLPAWALVPPGISNFVETPPQFSYAADDQLDREDAARKLLEEAGVTDLAIQLSYNTGENHKNTMAAIGDMLSNIGVTTTMNEMEGTTYFKYLREGGDYDIARAGWIGDYSDPQSFLFLYESGVPFNYPGWSNAEYDAKMDAAALTEDLPARAKLLAEAEEIFLRDVPAIPVLFYSSRALVSPKLTGWVDNILDNHATRWLTLSQ